MRVLVVDDNPSVLRLICSVLQTAGMAVMPAANALECQRLLERGLPEAIVLDMQLPEKDGFTLARELKADPKTKAIPILAVTSYALSGDEERALAAGCDAYVSKPIDTRSFADVVASLRNLYPTP